MRTRRLFVRTTLLVAACLLPLARVHAHTPYAQWNVFRKRHLQVLTSRADLAGDAFGDAWVAVLADKLPLARAVVSRTRDLIGQASLLKTDQAKLAVFSHEHAQAMFTAVAPFQDFGEMPVQILLENDTHVLVARENFPLEHGFLVVATLLEHAVALQVSVPLQPRSGIPVHPGARAAANGETIEPKPALK